MLTSKPTPPEVAHGESLLRTLADNLPVAIAYYEKPTQRCVFANRQYAESNGWTVETILGHTVREAIGEAAWHMIEPHVRRVLNGERVEYVRPTTMPGKEERYIEVILIPHFDGGGTQIGAFVLINDITRHHRAEQAIRDSEERMRKFAAATTEGIFFHRNGTVTDVNDALLAIMGYAREEMLGRNTLEFVPEEQRDKVSDYIRAGQENVYECDIVHKDGRLIPTEMVGKTVRIGEETLRLGVLRDVSERKRAEARMEHMARHDALTGLPNRAFLGERLDGLLALARRHGESAAILYLDLDNFKTVNDSLGHHAGDELLREIAARIKGALRDADIVARLGGDEFLVALAEVGAPGDATKVANKLLSLTSTPVLIDGHPVCVTGSIGISLFPRDADNADDLIRHADAAMYSAKQAGRANYQFYAPSLTAGVSDVLAKEARLREAIERGDFVVHYQPQFSLRDGALTGIEALVRWIHPQHGLQGPNEFVSFAESRGLIVPIGRWVIEEACWQAQTWRNAGAPDVPMSVNVSALQFRREALVGEVAHALHESRLAGAHLELELTESSLMDAATVTPKLDALRALGVRISVDDFGTGYSSMSYLKHYPIDKLKIDRSFIADMMADADHAAITIAIIHLGRALKLTVLAEGVEQQAQADFLKAHGCDEVQGFLTGRPLPAPEFARAFLKTMRPADL